MDADNLIKLGTLLSTVVVALLVYYTGTAATASAKQAASAAGRAEVTLAATASMQAEKLEKNHALMQTIHALVDGRLSLALEKIDRLEKRLYVLTGEVPTGEPGSPGTTILPTEQAQPPVAPTAVAAPPAEQAGPSPAEALVSSVQAMETALIEGVKNMQVTAETVVVKEADKTKTTKEPKE